MFLRCKFFVNSGYGQHGEVENPYVSFCDENPDSCNIYEDIYDYLGDNPNVYLDSETYSNDEFDNLPSNTIDAAGHSPGGHEKYNDNHTVITIIHDEPIDNNPFDEDLSDQNTIDDGVDNGEFSGGSFGGNGGGNPTPQEPKPDEEPIKPDEPCKKPTSIFTSRTQAQMFISSDANDPFSLARPSKTCEEKEKDWKLDKDDDGYGQSQKADKSPGEGWVLGTVKGPDCNDTNSPEGKAVHKNNKCGKCEAESKCNDCDSSKDDLKKIFPTTSDSKLQKIVDAINKYGGKLGLDNKEKVQHFLAQAGVESHNLNAFREYTNYRPARAVEVFPGKFNAIGHDNENPNRKNLSDFYTTGNKYLNAEDFYNWVYADENRSAKTRLGNTESGDGWKYRGRGIIQLTGRENYENFSNWYKDNINSNTDILNNPSLLQTDSEIGTVSGMYFFNKAVLSKITVDGNTSINKVTYRVNSKMEGLSDRKKFLKKAKENINCK